MSAFMLGTTVISAQSVGLVTPNETELDKTIVSNLRAGFSGTLRVQDPDMTDAAFRSADQGSAPFNLNIDDARRLAAVLGCDFYVLIRTGTQRRASIDKADYFESYAVFYVVSGRTGRLIKWNLVSQKGSDLSDAERRLAHSISGTELFESIAAAWKNEPIELSPPAIELIPEEGTPASKNFRSPVPYRRIKPDYTRAAYLYDITATVEATVDLDEKGQITRLEISRWAGYGLDESVAAAIRSMNWRPAERAGKALPIRFLLRYNFRKIEKDDADHE